MRLIAGDCFHQSNSSLREMLAVSLREMRFRKKNDHNGSTIECQHVSGRRRHKRVSLSGGKANTRAVPLAVPHTHRRSSAPRSLGPG